MKAVSTRNNENFVGTVFYIIDHLVNKRVGDMNFRYLHF